MGMNRKQKVEELLESMRAIRRHMALGASGREAASITPAQWGVLMLVGERGECSVKDIAAMLRISSSAATQLVNGLVGGGHLARKASQEDRRAVALSLSRQTKAKMKGMRDAALKKTLKLFEGFTDREFEIYITLNKKISDRLLKSAHD
jgi:DNA-binding MarR family transcriptional regulator